MSFLEFASERGLIINRLESGRILRTKTTDNQQKMNGAFLFCGEWGWAQNWATMIEPEYWYDKKERTPFEKKHLLEKIEASKKTHEKDRRDKQAQASLKAAWILSQCELDKHAYLDSKGFKETLGNVWRRENHEPLLVIPMYSDGLCGVQLIGIHGDKKFLFGQKTNDAFFKIGQTGIEIICEGYATALSIFTVCQSIKIPCTVYVTFSAGNASRIAKKHPSALWIADNDVSGTGQDAAAKSGLKWWMPPTAGTDFNDLHKEAGLFKAGLILKKVLHGVEKKI